MKDAGSGSRELCVVLTARQRFKKTDRIHRRWTAGEDGVLLMHCPNYSKIRELLPDRALKAIQGRCHNLGLTKRYKRWTTSEVKKLRESYSTKRWADLEKIFPGRTRHSIRHMGAAQGLRRSFIEHRPTGLAIIDEIRDRARVLGISLKILDLAVGSPCYFQMATRIKLIRYDLVEKAMEALGGQIVVVWND